MYKWPINIQRVQASKPPACDQIPSLTQPQKAFRFPPMAGGWHETSGKNILRQLCPPRMRGVPCLFLAPTEAIQDPPRHPQMHVKRVPPAARQQLHLVESLIGDRKFPDHPSWRLNSLFVQGELDNGMAGQRQRHFQRPSCLVSCNGSFEHCWYHTF